MDGQIITLENIRASEAIEFKYELISAGLVLDVDFQWTWYSPADNGTSKVEFIFKNPSHATFYKLRWE